MDIPHYEFKTYPLCISELTKYDSEFWELKSKYSLPDEPQQYNKMVETATLLYLPIILKDILKDNYENIEVKTSYFPSTGTDIVVNSNGHPLLKMEILNWWIRSILTEQRALRIRDNLKGAPFKVLCIPSRYNFLSASSKIKPTSEKALKGIQIYYTGYQILPITYFEYFNQLDSRFTLLRAIFGENTINHQKNRLKMFFEEIGLIPLVNTV
jgi:hypothetical protein